MASARRDRRAAERVTDTVDPVSRFSRGEISRKQAMRLLGGVSYGELLDMIADRRLPLPELPPEDIDRMADDVVTLLDMAGR